MINYISYIMTLAQKMALINELKNIATEPFGQFKVAVDNIDINQSFPTNNWPYVNFILLETLNGLELPVNEVEQKVHYLLEEKRVNPRLGRTINRGTLIGSPIADALHRKNRNNVDTVSRIISYLVSHGAILGNEEISLAKKNKFPEETIDEWKTHVAEGDQWIEYIEKMSTPEGRQDLQWDARKGRIMLEAGVDAAYNANVPGSHVPQSHIAKYLLNHWVGREIDTYTGLPDAPIKRGGKRRSKKNRKGKTKRSGSSKSSRRTKRK